MLKLTPASRCFGILTCICWLSLWAQMWIPTACQALVWVSKTQTLMNYRPSPRKSTAPSLRPYFVCYLEDVRETGLEKSIFRRETPSNTLCQSWGATFTSPVPKNLWNIKLVMKKAKWEKAITVPLRTKHGFSTLIPSSSVCLQLSKGARDLKSLPPTLPANDDGCALAIIFSQRFYLWSLLVMMVGISPLPSCFLGRNPASPLRWLQVHLPQETNIGARGSEETL